MPRSQPSPSELLRTEKDRPLLTLAWSVLAERVGDITIPDLSGVGDGQVELLICAQGRLGAGIPSRARVVQVDGFGVARSRNAAIANANGRYVMFCDDDITVSLDGAMASARYLARTGRVLALGAAIDPEGVPRKRYPTRPRTLGRFNAAKAATYEMVLDVDASRSNQVWFDTRFGAGGELPLGDEYIFIADLLAAGLRADAVPWVLATHPAESSGHRWGTAADAHHRAVVLNRVFGRWAVAARMLFAAKHVRRLGGVAAALRLVADRTRPP